MLKKEVQHFPLPERLLSLDVLRGLDMFFITGGALLIQRLAAATDWGFFKVLAGQMEHASWQGITLFDMIFPLFMFISGVAIIFSQRRHDRKDQSKATKYKKIIRRCVILICLGFIYNGLLRFDFSNFRYVSVLAQIGIAYLLTAFIVINTKKPGILMLWTAAILAVYSMIQLLVPVPGAGAGVLTPTASINAYVDQLVLPGKLYGGSYDPEGVLCIISATAITLIGAIAGTLLRNQTLYAYKKVIVLGAAGCGMLVLGIVLGNWYPIIKNIWTSTFNLVAGGICFLILALFYLVIDVWKIRKWCFYFQVIGLNAITVYMGVKIFKIKHSSEFLLTGLANMLGDFGPILHSLGFLAIVWLALYVLYRQNIFLRV